MALNNRKSSVNHQYNTIKSDFPGVSLIFQYAVTESSTT